MLVPYSFESFRLKKFRSTSIRETLFTMEYELFTHFLITSLVWPSSLHFTPFRIDLHRQSSFKIPYRSMKILRKFSAPISVWGAGWASCNCQFPANQKCEGLDLAWMEFLSGAWQELKQRTLWLRSRSDIGELKVFQEPEVCGSVLLNGEHYF